MVMLLVHIWNESERQPVDNRSSVSGSSAPLIPFLKRIEAIEPSYITNEDYDPEGTCVLRSTV